MNGVTTAPLSPTTSRWNRVGGENTITSR